MAGDPFAEIDAAVHRLTERANRGRGMFIRVTIVDDAAETRRGLDRVFDAFDATMDELPAVLRDALPAIRAGFAANFATEGAAGSGAWAPLAPRTLRDRARLGFGPGPILTRTGALQAHVLGAPARITSGGGGVELRIRPDKVVDGVPKYDALAKGYAPNSLPGRPMVVLGPASANRVASAISRSLRERARAHGL